MLHNTINLITTTDKLFLNMHVTYVLSINESIHLKWVTYERIQFANTHYQYSLVIFSEYVRKVSQASR